MSSQQSLQSTLSQSTTQTPPSNSLDQNHNNHTTTIPSNIHITTSQSSSIQSAESNTTTDDDASITQTKHTITTNQTTKSRNNPRRKQNNTTNYKEDSSSSSGSATTTSHENNNSSDTHHAFERYDPAWKRIYEIQPSKQRRPSQKELETEKAYHQTTIPLAQIKDNNHWGDDITKPDEGYNRIWFQNIQGLPRHNNDKFKAIIDTMDQLSVSIMGFAEPNLAIKTKRKDQFQKILRQQFNQGHITTSESDLTFPTEYKPGGTITAATGPWTTRITGRGTDPHGLGRWSYIKMQSKKKKLIIATIYRPNETKGTKTVWTQQYLLLRTKGIMKPNPVKALYRDLDRQLEEWREDNCEIILMMDANEVPGTKPGDIGTVFAKHGLIDIHLARLSDDNEPSTYARGSRRIDYMYATQFVSTHTIRTGSPPFGTGSFQSDHRGLFADINISAILNDTVSAIDSPSARLLNSKVVQDRKKFIAEYEQHLQAHNIYERIHKLSMMTTEELVTQQDELNLIDQTRAEGMIAAEKKACQRRPFAWSPKLKKCILLAFLWKQALSMHRTGINRQKVLQKLAEATNDFSIFNDTLTLKSCSKALRAAQKELREAKKNHESLRQQFLVERQIELSDDPNQKVNQQIVQRIQRAEAKRRSHARIKTAMTDTTKGGLTHIIVPKGSQPDDYPYEPETVTEWEKIYDPKLIEQYILARNKAHFSQAQGTPFTIPPLDKIGHAADTDEADQILRGEIPDSFSGADEFALKILREIGSSNLPPLQIQFETEQIKQSFRKWKETTSTSPSNNHLGLWRSMTYPTENKEDSATLN
jgi:hypothetical protein